MVPKAEEGGQVAAQARESGAAGHGRSQATAGSSAGHGTSQAKAGSRTRTMSRNSDDSAREEQRRERFAATLDIPGPDVASAGVQVTTGVLEPERQQSVGPVAGQAGRRRQAKTMRLDQATAGASQVTTRVTTRVTTSHDERRVHDSSAPSVVPPPVVPLSELARREKRVVEMRGRHRAEACVLYMDAIRLE